MLIVSAVAVDPDNLFWFDYLEYEPSAGEVASTTMPATTVSSAGESTSNSASSGSSSPTATPVLAGSDINAPPSPQGPSSSFPAPGVLDHGSVTTVYVSGDSSADTESRESSTGSLATGDASSSTLPISTITGSSATTTVTAVSKVENRLDVIIPAVLGPVAAMVLALVFVGFFLWRRRRYTAHVELPNGQDAVEIDAASHQETQGKPHSLTLSHLADKHFCRFL